MSSITFSGLASGIDTASIIESIIELERAPVTAMEEDQTYLQTKLDSYSQFNTLLEDFNLAVMGLNSADDLNANKVTNNGAGSFSVSATSLANEGTYAVEIVSLASQQKDVSTNAIADTDTTLLSGELQFGDQDLTYEDLSLSDLMERVNEGDYGVTATLINDGTDSGYRLLLTAATAGEEIEITGTGALSFDTATTGHTVTGTKAHLVVDEIEYYSTSNTVTNALKGAVITLLAESEDGAANVLIESDAEEVIATQLEEIVSAYNAINTYIDTITASDPSLATAMKSVQRNLKSHLTSQPMVALGLSSNWETGELTFAADTFTAAYGEDAEAVKKALIGEGDQGGIMTSLDSYLNDQMDATTGFLVTKENTIDKQISRLDDRIAAMETRIEKRQEMLEAQFTAMETLISSLNSQGDYLTSFFDSYSSGSD